MTAFSFQVLAGIYSGFYANWLAIILGYSTQALMIRSLKRPSVPTMVALGVAVSGILLAHVYTWTIIMSVNFVFLFVLLILNYYPKKRILVIYLILSTSIAVDVLKSSWIGSPSGLEADLSLGNRSLGLAQFSDRINTLSETVLNYYGGVYANIAILGLAVYWLVRCRTKELSTIFLLIFLSSALVPLFIGDWILQSRVLYDIPFQIPAAIALFYISKGSHKLVAIATLLVAFLPFVSCPR